MIKLEISYEEATMICGGLMDRASMMHKDKNEEAKQMYIDLYVKLLCAVNESMENKEG